MRRFTHQSPIITEIPQQQRKENPLVNKKLTEINVLKVNAVPSNKLYETNKNTKPLN